MPKSKYSRRNRSEFLGAVKDLHSIGLNDTEVANRLGVSVTSAYEARADLGLPSNRIKMQKDICIKAEKLFSENLSDRAIAKIVGVSPNSIARLRKKLAIPGKRLSRNESDWVISLVSQGMTHGEVADIVGMSRYVVQAIMYRHRKSKCPLPPSAPTKNPA